MTKPNPIPPEIVTKIVDGLQAAARAGKSVNPDPADLEGARVAARHVGMLLAPIIAADHGAALLRAAGVDERLISTDIARFATVFPDLALEETGAREMLTEAERAAWASTFIEWWPSMGLPPSIMLLVADIDALNKGEQRPFLAASKTSRKGRVAMGDALAVTVYKEVLRQEALLVPPETAWQDRAAAKQRTKAIEAATGVVNEQRAKGRSRKLPTSIFPNNSISWQQMRKLLDDGAAAFGDARAEEWWAACYKERLGTHLTSREECELDAHRALITHLNGVDRVTGKTGWDSLLRAAKGG